MADQLATAGRGACRRLPLRFAVVAVALLPFWNAAGAAATDPVPLSSLMPVSVRQDYGELEMDRSVQGLPLKIGDREFAHGLGTHANSEIIYDLDGGYTNFTAWIGVDEEMKGYTNSTVVFQVFGDSRKLFESGVMRLNEPARRVSVNVADVEELKLVVTDAGDGINCDHADWCDPVLLGAKPEEVGVAKYRIVTPGLTIGLDAHGRIVSSSVAALTCQTRLGGCRQVGEAAVKQLAGGGYAFTRTLADAHGHHCALTDRWRPTKNSVRWEIELVSGDAPWSTTIETRLRYPATEATRFWTAWSDPEHRADGWRDPLVLRPLANLTWTFGGPVQRGDYIALPLATLVEPTVGVGLSLVFSPEDTILVGSRLATTPAGAIRFGRTNHRLGGGKPVRFALDLVAHEADWRGGLRWMTARYPEFFNPPNPLAVRMAGCGAYSGDENPVEVARLRQMAFRINWKMSDDFPYMGMFIPPVKNPDERWERSCDEKAPSNKPRWTTCRRLNDYAHYMKTNGFYVLNYFNVTEFGKNMAGAPTAQPGDPELWKDPRALLKYALPGAVLLPGDATCYHASVTDCGDPAYRKFLLEQAERHLRWIPDSFGFCIDRLDWLDRANDKADDGLSWIGGKPARSLCVSWMRLLSQLGPKVHAAHKVIFVNPIYARLDLLRQVDGIYTEQGNEGRPLNTSAFLGLNKPVLAWSYNETLIQPDPDSFMQRHLYLGIYPTAPYPWNNHCLNPEPAADKLYLDYGPLLDALRGKKWVLTPHCVESDAAKVNLFEVPGGYTLPVTFADKAETITVRVRNVPGLKTARCDAIHPGKGKPVPLSGQFKDGELKLTVPLVRGCAMVRLQN